MPALRGALREGGVSVSLPPAVVPLRLRVRRARSHLHGLHAEGVRGRDRCRHAARRASGSAKALARCARRGGRCRCASPRSTRASRIAPASSAASTRSSTSCRRDRRPSGCSPASGLGSGTARSIEQRRSRGRAPPARTRAATSRSRRPRRRAARRRRRGREASAENRCAAPTRPRARSLGGSGDREPVPGHDENAGDDERRDEQRERRIGARRDERRSRRRGQRR